MVLLPLKYLEIIDIIFVLFLPRENTFVSCHTWARLALAMFREDREELCNLSRRRYSLDSLSSEASQRVFGGLERSPSTCVLQLDSLANKKSTSSTRPYKNTIASRRSPLVQPSSGLQRVLQLHQSLSLAGNNPVSALQRRASQSTNRLPRPEKNPRTDGKNGYILVYQVRGRPVFEHISRRLGKNRGKSSAGLKELKKLIFGI